MAYYGGRGYPARSPNVIYNPYGNFNQPNFQSAYVNRGFNPSPFYPGGYGQPPRRPPAIGPRPQPQAQPKQRNSRMIILCTILSLVALLVVLGIVGAIVGVVLSNQGGNGGGTTDPQPTQGPVFTQAPQPQPTQAPQPQPTQAPQPQPTQAPQPQPTQAPQPQPTQAPQPQPTVAPQPQPTVAPQPIEGDIFSTGICGTQPALANRIVGGTDAQLGHWPWIGSLQLGGGHSCGATLLNERWAVSAAHCFQGISADTIVLGLTNTDNPEAGFQSRQFTTFQHPDYNDATLDNDIILLRLTQTVSFTDNIVPMCLATLVEETTMYTNCQAAGWGETQDPNKDAAKLQEVNLPLISAADCGDGGEAPNIVCAGQPQGGVDTCQGDSGGPLICENRVDNSWHLVGIVSFGVSDVCAERNSPGRYARVTHFLTWIQSTVNANP